jgi:hypothetical protein
VSFSASANGIAPLSYQWLFGSNTIADATNRTVLLTNVTATMDGRYSVIVSNNAGSVQTRLARLQVDATFTKITTGGIVTDQGDGESMAWIDYNNDGFVDLFSGVGSAGPNNFLYRNNGDGTFTRMTAATAGSVVQTGGEDSAWGDYDNDGFLDLFVVTDSGPAALHHGNANGIFNSVAAGPLLNGNGTRHRAAAWADYDGDGYIDLFVTTQNRIYRNDGNGTFTATTNAAIVTSAVSPNCTWIDYNNDGRPDLWAAAGLNSPNYLYRNDGNGVFTRVGAEQAQGVVSIPAYSGVFADYDNDGFADLWTTAAFGVSGQHLYHNNRDGTFTEVTTQSGLTDLPNAISGTWGDYDNDGYLDLFVSSRSKNLLYHNNGNGSFTLVSSGSVSADASLYNEDYSCAWGDYNNDGFLDLSVGSINGGVAAPNFLYKNNGNSNAWLKVKLIGTSSNRAAIGAKVHVQTTIGGKTVSQLREVCGGGGYGAQNLLPQFGLGDSTNAQLIRIEWPSGIVQEFSNSSSRRQLTITEPARLVLNAPGELILKSWKSIPHAIEATEDLVNWLEIGGTTNSDVASLFLDSGFGSHPRRFYRAVAR